MFHVDINSIFELNYTLQNTFFSKLKDDFDFPEDLKDTHIKALIIIREANGIAMSQVSHRLNLVKGAFTPVANRLIKFGFVEKIKSNDDKRISHLVLTEKGSDFVSELMEAITNSILKKVNKLSNEEKDAYLAAIRFVLSMTKRISD